MTTSIENPTIYMQGDPGTSEWKISFFTSFGNIQEFIFPALFYPSQSPFLGLDSWSISSPAEYAGLVGEQVQDFNPSPITRDSETYLTNQFRLGLLFAVARVLDTIGCSEHVNVSLALALPAQHISQIKDIRDWLMMDSICIDRHKARMVTFTSVEAIEQGAAVTYHALFRWEGHRLTASGADRMCSDGQVLIGCFGTNSAEFCLFKGSFATLETHSVFFGFLEIQEELARVVYECTGRNLNQVQLLKIMREGDYTYKGKHFDFMPILGEMTAMYFGQEKFRSEISRYLAKIGFDTDDRGSVILAGGVLLHDHQVIFDMFDGICQRIELATDETGAKDTARFSVLHGLQKYHSYQFLKEAKL